MNKHEQTEKLIKQTMLQASDDLTDRIMSKLENPKRSFHIISWRLHFSALCVLLSILGVFVILIITPIVSLINETFFIPRLSVQILLITVIVIALNSFLAMGSELKSR